ncbi:MAG: choice-of-anchor D domain-containing protein, partial [Bacteroidetes bacterium]|nr:choice-of-anchor D domain-containing protein [Bacteroidota bacterium]
NNMSLLVTDATIAGNALMEGDYVGVFTGAGLCAGYGRVGGDGFPVGLAAWGDDADTEAVEGFVAGEALLWRLWDMASGREYLAEPSYGEGVGRYSANGFAALSLRSLRRLSPAEGEHFGYVQTGDNHSLLVEEAFLDGSSLQAGDEVGVFTPGGLCAGAVIVEAEGGRLGLPAFGDDVETEGVDGFRAGEGFGFRYWDVSAGLEIAAEATYLEGPEVWTANGFTQVLLSGRTPREPVGQVTLQGGEAVDVLFYFNPGRVGDYAGRYEVESDDPYRPVVGGGLVGVGVMTAPELVIAPSSHDYGTLLAGEESSQAFTLTNIGMSDLVVEEVYAEGGAYGVDFGGSFTLAEGESRQFVVTFHPAAAGDYPGRLVAVSNDP